MRQAGAIRGGAPLAEDLSLGRILIAEDNRALARVTAFNLRRHGFEVLVAHDGRAAWEQLRRQHFDLVITDQQMPEMTGLDLCAAMRGSEMHARVPIVFLTAKGLELDRRQLEDEFGVSRTYCKPFSPSEIVAGVREILDAAPAHADSIS